MPVLLAKYHKLEKEEANSTLFAYVCIRQYVCASASSSRLFALVHFYISGKSIIFSSRLVSCLQCSKKRSVWT